MKARLRNWLEKLRTSYWFVPSTMLVGSMIVAWGATALDRSSIIRDGSKSIFYSGDIDSARSLLSTVGGSAITVAGVVFSITIAALTMASSQFGPRLLRNFMRDRGNQFVLGTFVATYLYCLVVQRSLSAAEAPPNLAVSIGLLLGLASLCVLIYFIHHVALSIQAPTLVARVGKELLSEIDTLFPEHVGEHHEQTEDSDGVPESLEPRPVHARSSGYLQAVENEKLMRIACENDLIVRLFVKPGHFVTEGQTIMQVYPHTVRDKYVEALLDTLLISVSRSPEQDVEYSIHQLVEICLRALSPSINDPFTANTCIDWLGVAMAKLACRRVPSTHRYDQKDRLRIIAPRVTFSGAMSAAFNQPRQASVKHVSVTIRIFEALETIAKQCANDPDAKAVVRHHILSTWERSRVQDLADIDHADIATRKDAALSALA
jgi:uncharacterized membrane protein